MRRAATAVLLALTLTGTAAGGTSPAPGATGLPKGFAPASQRASLTQRVATSIFLGSPKVSRWLERYPPRPVTQATYDAKRRDWGVKVWSGPAGEVATGRVDDASRAVTEAWTGPQVAWKMARGSKGAFGRKTVNGLPFWLGFCALFLLGLGDLRRPLSLRNLDLLVLLSFGVSLFFFNRGDIFTSVPLAYPPLLYLLARTLWIGVRGRGPRRSSRPQWPVWLLVGVTVFVAGFRVGLNVRDSNVIDVGYAGVIGGERIAHGQMPYGHMPVAAGRKACGPADVSGETREYVQKNGRCETANERGDTYGPVSYLAYVPGYVLLGWNGHWTGGAKELPAAHLTAILFDLLCLAGLALVGLRFGGARLAAVLAFAWVAYPFTQYASNSNTNDAIAPAFLIWGFWLASSPRARGALVALSGWTKFASLLLAPLWLSYGGWRRPRSKLLFLAGFAAATATAFSVLLLEPNPLSAARIFYERTLGWQVGRESPFSIWDWRQYHAGLPDLHLVQRVLQALLLVGVAVTAVLPRRTSPLQLAALSAALLLGFELVLTHWFYLYIPWFFPFVAFALLAPGPVPAEPVQLRARELRELTAVPVAR